MSSLQSSRAPFLTANHVQKWVNLGPPLREKPSTEEQLKSLKDRKLKMQQLKEELMVIAKTECSVKVSGKTLELELDRLAQRHWDGMGENTNEDDDEDGISEHIRNPGHPDNMRDYRSEGGPLLQYLWAPLDNPIQGQSMYLGGEVGSDSNIYCIPGHANRVLKINTHTNTVQPIGPEYLTTGNGRLYKWLRGIVVGDLIYGLPCHADSILRIDVTSQTVTQIPIPYSEWYPDNLEKAEEERVRNWKYHGGSVCPIDNCIYAIPQSAEHVLKLDPTTETITRVGPSLPGRCKWYGGIVGKQDGAIYGIPQNASGVLRITPTAVTVHGHFEPNQHHWHGGAAAENGVIVSVPANADTVLCIRPADTVDGEPTLTEIGDSSVIQSGRHRDDGKYKYLGAMMGTNGKVYIFPCASEYVLEVDTVHGKARNVGPNLRDTGMESVHQNKWQNGLTCWQDDCVYGMPLSGHTLLRVNCSGTNREEDSPAPTVTTWMLPPPRIGCRDKFEGGVYHNTSGIMYTVPNNHKGILRIESACLGNENK